MRLTYLLSILGLLFCQWSYAQDGWELSLGDFPLETETEVIQATDSSFFVFSLPTVYKVSKEGEFLWETTFNNDFPELNGDFINNVIGGVAPASDGGAVVLSNSNNAADTTHIILSRIGPDGTLIWTQVFEDQTDLAGLRVIGTSDGGFAILASLDDDGGVYTEAILIKVNEQGQELWRHTLQSDDQFYPFALLEHSNGDILTGVNIGTGYFSDTTSIDVNFQRFTSQGSLVWSETYDLLAPVTFLSSMSETPDGGIVAIGQYLRSILFPGVEEMTDTYAIKLNGNGTLQWTNTYQVDNEDTQQTTLDLVNLSRFGAFFNGITTLQDGTLTFGSTRLLDNTTSEITVFKINQQGDQIWRKTPINGENYTHFKNGAITACYDGGFLIAGSRDEKVFLLKLTGEGLLYSTSIVGKVTKDENEDCLEDANATGQNGLIVKAETASGTFYGTTDTDGNYVIGVPQGDYIVSVTPNSLYWGVCNNGQQVTLDQPDTDVTADFLLNENISCPLMEVSISAPFLRRCFESTYYVQYQNLGTVTAEDASVEVALDDFLSYQGSSIPFSSQSGNLYTFDIGDVAPGASGTFSVNFLVSCEAELGQTHCTDAHIFPDSLCIPTDPLWDGSSIQLDGECVGDSIIFTITNAGDDMQEELYYMVVEDELILMQDPFQLNAGQTISFVVYPNGSTFHLMSQQSNGHPLPGTLVAFVEGCGSGENGEISLGIINQFSVGDGAIFEDRDCQANIGAFDPNDKRAYPFGYGDDHLLEPNTDLEYHIRFQNTGTDTAFTVKIRDVIDENLNVESIQPGASSHPYRFEVKEEGVVYFHFENIMLPDSNVNEPASHGFVRFRIAQKPNVALGTKLFNRAEIFFDYNEAVITNEVMHTIGLNFIEVVSVQPDPGVPGLELQVYPNPASDLVNFDLEGVDIRDGILHLYNMSGQEIKRLNFSGRKFQYSASELSKGVYFFRLEGNGRNLGSGKLMVK